MAWRNKIKIRWLDVSYIPLLLTAILTVITVYIVFIQTQDILKGRLRERITAIVATAALQFEGESIQKIIDNENLLAEKLEPLLNESAENFEESSYVEKIKSDPIIGNNPIYETTDKMKKIRNENINLTYIYILRITDTANVAKFVTDADTVLPVDWDESGRIEDIEYPPLPGEDYDITDIPAVYDAQLEPVAMPDLYTDKWGTFLSGYAPIKDSNGNTVAVLGIDVEVGDFFQLIRATLIPFIGLAVILLLILTVQTVALVRIWKNRVDVIEELDRQKDELLAIVSHQLATPVSSLKWYIEMLIEGDIGKVSKEQKKHLESMFNVSQNLSDLVSMILDVSRIQLGRMKIEKKELELKIFFEEIIEIINTKVDEKEIIFEHRIPKKLPKAYLDKRYTHMIIENLLSNAVKYTPKGGKVFLNVEVNNGQMLCTISDTGCGIPKNDQDKIFGKLYRASNVANKIDGNGFGLFIAKGAVESQGGKIWFSSTENKGTKFYVKLPLFDTD